MQEIPCPDGYLLNSNSPVADGHHTLNDYLVRFEDAGWKVATKELNALRGKPLKLRIWTALVERLAWLRANHPDSPYFNQLHGLTYSVEKWSLALSEAELIDLLGRTGELAGQVSPYTPMPHLMAYVEEHGLTPALSAAIRQFDTRVRGADFYVNQVSRQLLNSRLDMLAWRDEWSDIKLTRCWSEQIRADYRSMRGPARECWRRILHSIDGDEGMHPAPKWLARATDQIEALGAQSVQTQLTRWFEPLRRGRTVPLSREGSFILRSFIWLAQILNSPELMARVAEIAEVQFKPKKNCDKVIRAAAEAAGKPDPTVKPAKPVPSLNAITARALTAVFAPGATNLVKPETASRVRADGEVVYVRGDLDTYRMHVSTGAVFRESDGRRVHVNVEHNRFAAVPVPDFGGIGELLSQLLILAEDAKHARALTTTIE